MLLNYLSSARRRLSSSISVSTHAHSVRTFINSLTPFVDDPASFSQVLTLYNPYEFAVRYKGRRRSSPSIDLITPCTYASVLCTASQKYAIVEPQGEIRAQHSVDL